MVGDVGDLQASCGVVSPLGFLQHDLSTGSGYVVEPGRGGVGLNQAGRQREHRWVDIVVGKGQRLPRRARGQLRNLADGTQGRHRGDRDARVHLGDGEQGRVGAPGGALQRPT